MNASPLKIIVPLALLMGIVFAVTFFSRYTPTQDPNGDTINKAKVESREKPLRFFTSSRRWDPLSFDASLADRIFPGFYEAGETQHSAAFWFENRNPHPVSMKLHHVSCSACSGARVAALKPEALKAVLELSFLSALPMGPVLTGVPVGVSGAAANLLSGLQWQSHAFNEDPNGVLYTVPAATGDIWAPQWGILDVNFKVRQNPSVPLRATFVTQVQGTDQISQDEFSIWFEPANPFELDKTSISVGTLTDQSPEQMHEITVYSSVRPLEELQNLSVRVLTPGGEPGEFVTTGPPVPLEGEDLFRFMQEVSNKNQRPIRVVSALRIPVRVRARVGEARPDIGPFDRGIWIAAVGGEPKKVAVTGTVRGPVSLSDGAEIKLTPFKYEKGTTQTFEIRTARTGIELAVVPDQARPKFLRVNLKKQPDRGERGYYQVEITIPPNEQLGEISDGAVVLELKGPNPQRYRIPVKGRGER